MKERRKYSVRWHRIVLMALMMVHCSMGLAQSVDNSKLSQGVIEALQKSSVRKAMGTQGRAAGRLMALMSFTQPAQRSGFLADYDVEVIDSIGRVYIVNIPLASIGPATLDSRIERIEAERMPRPSMDVTPGQVNANGVYAGTGLPQAYDGTGVVAGVFDSSFDFTHPAFLDADGNTRVKYYYDFHWPNDDGTFGHELASEQDIMDYGHSQHTYESIHGTHVMGIMAGSAVEGKYQGMAPGADIYAVDFNSMREQFENTLDPSSAVAVLGFKYIFDQAQKAGKPCVINFSSCESITIARQRILEGEALQALTGPGRIIVAGAGNMGTNATLVVKPEGTQAAGAGINYGIGGGGTIDMDIVTPGNQLVRFDFLGLKFSGGQIEGTIFFNTDSVAALAPEPCVLKTTVSFGEVTLRVTKSTYEDPRGDVFHVQGDMPNITYLMLCGAACLLSGDSPAWMYSDLFLSPFANVTGNALYSHAEEGYTVAWPATLDGIIAVGATGYKNTVVNIDGDTNTDVLSFAPDKTGHLAKFSSCGPTFEGAIKPDVVAPGLNIIAPYGSHVSTFESDRKSLTDHIVYKGKDYYYLAESGTSMSCPVAAGTIALWLQANPELTPADVLEVIAKTSTKPEPAMDYPNNKYGYGQIDAYAGLLHILNTSSRIPSLSTRQPAKARFALDGRMLTVDAEDGTPSSALITVYDLKGVVVAKSAGTAVDLSSLPSGVYAVQLTTSDAQTTGSTLIRL